VPPARGRIVVRPRVDDRVGDVVVGQIRIVGMAVEGELQHPRSGNPERAAERGHVWRDRSQVLRDEGQTAERLLDGAEEAGARARYPLAGLRRRRPGRDLPRRLESPEMIET